MTDEAPLLWSPLTIRGLTLRNRVMISPMAMYSAADGRADDFHLVHLGRFALGSAGLVFAEATAVSEQGRITHGCVGLWHDDQIPGFRRIADFLHRFGAAAGIQLCHSGHKGSSQRPWHGGGPLGPADLEARGEAPWPSLGVTETPFGTGWPQPRQATAADLDRLVADFAEAARRADAAGLDVIEVHCAHGYMLHSFLSPVSNTRTDGYGGDLAGRMRFPLRVAAAVRAAFPAEKPVFVRVSAVDGVDVGWTMEDTIVFAKALKAIGIDAVDCSTGGMMLARQQMLISRSPGFQVPFAAGVRREAGIASIAVGLIRDATHAEEILQAGDADLIAIAREALVDPNWAAEAALRTAGDGGWQQWPERFGWWLMRRARQQGESFGPKKTS
ncbi:NADH:flavin oxidoreductase/NADH oxidase [Zavarzinia compransoris]|uniref:NADH:flavin oxidoreductase / NADH oxidase n=1 Tax=Zavarzinia compransoris TaxID=1264899 RepID=A0A317E5K6_9PROT|nr:NADH:flavin oxidoreductase/NADH oxidase [Zavarzinia compransoris]PWR21634.1 NADH:flavin oxidoreductase / NADH oxidase [Zavarzinia compransoris]TDP45586.1 2,4-dienoyl-CoA reductase-like NADH-dependent reductase (Old Yellow Enzyme family) [Zavarzinia compransoris]